jgi:hypothetical protein
MRIILVVIFLFIGGVSLSQDFEDSGWCQDHNNVNNLTIPPSLDNVKRSVFVYSNSQIYGCTGTLVNQITNQNNLQQYFF